MKAVVFLAPPVAGKGTHAKYLKEKLHLSHISTGDLLREKVKEDDELAYYLREVLSTGELVKDEIVYQLLEERLKQEDCKNGYILDGFPRNIDQAKKLEEIQTNKTTTYVILFRIEEELLKRRIIGRRVCENCGKVYNINCLEHAPKEESTCDTCGGHLYQRSDDNIASFEVRYQTYLDNVDPLIDYYRNKGCLFEIDANQNEEEIKKQIEKIVTSKIKRHKKRGKQ